MRRNGPAAVVFLVFLTLPVGLLAQERIKPADAVKYIGKSATVCGLVASAAFAVGNLGTPTYLNLDKPYPDQPFTVIIWGDKRNKFPKPPETFYNGKKICVTGTIAGYNGQPQMAITGPSQITFE
jgi:hypothetical protein